MIFSSVFDNIIKAYASFLRVVSTPKRSAQNSHLKNHYSTLDDVKKAVDDALQSNELIMIQSPTHETGQPANVLLMETRIIHVPSGEFISDICQIPLAKSDSQGYGSALTYARRYAMVTMFGLKMKDDDGNKSIRTATDWKRAMDSMDTADKVDNLLREALATFNGDDAAIKVLRVAAADQKTKIKMAGRQSFNPAAPKNAKRGTAKLPIEAYDDEPEPVQPSQGSEQEF